MGYRAKIYQQLANSSWFLVTKGPSITFSVDEPGTVIPVPTPYFFELPAGPRYRYVEEFIWYEEDGTTVDALIDVAYTSYRPKNILNPPVTFPDSTVCSTNQASILIVGSTSGTVNSTFGYVLHRYPLNVSFPITWSGQNIGAAFTDDEGFAHGNFKIPASTIGPHPVRFRYGNYFDTHIIYTIKPRIKIIPNENISRGETVDVSLRGFAAHQTVYIKWKKGNGYTQINHVTTSSTSSANIDVHVPKWVPNGATSARAESSAGNAQTNAVTVCGGPFVPSAVTTPTPTPTKTPSATATSTPPVETATPEATSSPETATPEPSPTDTVQPTATSSPTEEALTPTPGQVEVTSTP